MQQFNIDVGEVRSVLRSIKLENSNSMWKNLDSKKLDEDIRKLRPEIENEMDEICDESEWQRRKPELPELTGLKCKDYRFLMTLLPYMMSLPEMLKTEVRCKMHNLLETSSPESDEKKEMKLIVSNFYNFLDDYNFLVALLPCLKMLPESLKSGMRLKFQDIILDAVWDDAQDHEF